MNRREKRIILTLIALIAILGGVYVLTYRIWLSREPERASQPTDRPLTTEEVNSLLGTLAPPKASSTQINPPLSEKEQELVSQLAPPIPKTVIKSNPDSFFPPPPSPETQKLLDSLAPPKHD